MSEGTHSPTADATEFNTPPAPHGQPEPRFTAAQKRKWSYLIGGTVLVVAVAAAGLFQVFRPKTSEAGAERGNRAGYVPRDLDTKLALIDGQPITWRQVAEECMGRHGREILDNMINRRIIQQACARQDITVTEAEVAAEITRIAQKFRMEPANWFQMLQAERNITPKQYTRDIIWPMLALKKIAGAKVSITEKELHDLYIREYGARVEARMILLDNSRHATDVHGLLMRNPSLENFEQLALKHSIEPNSRALGGVIPPIRRFSGNKKLVEAAFRLRKGQISAIQQVGASRFVILMSGGLTKPKVTYEQVRNEVYEQLKEEKTQQAVAQIFNKLRQQTRVNNFLTNTSSGIRRTSGTRQPAGRARVGGNSYPPSSTQRRSDRRKIQ